MKNLTTETKEVIKGFEFIFKSETKGAINTNREYSAEDYRAKLKKTMELIKRQEMLIEINSISYQYHHDTMMSIAIGKQEEKITLW